ncbi:MAG: ATP-binding protein [Candidatus Omnitrophota bacterium]
MTKEQLYRDTVKFLLLTLNRISLYSFEHPVVKESSEKVYGLFQEILSQEGKMTVALGSNQLIINGTILEEKFLGVRELNARLRELKVDSFSVDKQVRLDELFNFIYALSKKKESAATKGPSREKIIKNGSEHIKINKVRYEQVSEGQKVVSSDLDQPQVSRQEVAQKEPLPQEVSEQFQDLLSGQVREILIGKESIFNQLDKNPRVIAGLILEIAKKSGSLKELISKFCQWLLDNAIDDLIKKKKDPAKLLLGLEKEIKKHSHDPSLPENIKSEISLAPPLFSEYSNSLRLEALVNSYSEKKDLKKLSQIAGKFLIKKEDKSEILPLLEEKLRQRGITSEEYNLFLKGLEGDKEKVSISKTEYEDLLKKSKEFNEELDKRIKQVSEEYQKLNRRLKDEKERVDTVIRNLADGLVVVDKDGNVNMMNPAAEKLLSVEAKNQVGKPLLDGIKEEHLLAMAKGPLDDKGEHITKEIELMSQDETTKRVLRASSAVVENQAGKTVGMVSVLSDITREKELEKMKSNFVAHVSHELRTPIVAMQKSLSLILGKNTGELNPDQEKFLNIANSNLQRLFRLINNILDMSKIEAHKLDLAPSLFNINEVIQEVGNTLDNWAKEKGLSLELKITPQDITVNADKDRIVQLMTNIIGNAIKFTPSGGSITVEAKQLTKTEQGVPGEFVQVEISDTGIGLQQDDLTRVFNKFEQVSQTQQSGIGGTGLGLTICKEIVELHKGHIWVESQINKGSKFIFIIPKGGQNG